MNESKPWYQSKTIWGTVTMLLVAVLSLFQIQVSDLSPDIQQGLEGLGLLIGAGVTIWGRITAKQSLAATKSAASVLLFFLLGSMLIFGPVGCASSTTTATDSTATTTTTVSGWDKFLASLKSAVHVGLSAMQTAAKALYTLTDNLTPTQLDAYLATFGVDADTRADVIAAYKQAGSSALAAYQIATTIDGATVATQTSN